jgi:hypothetical protein
LIGMCAIVATGCGARGLYHWGKYEDSLYLRYVKTDQDEARAYVEKTLERAERDPGRVPPGLYADYGFLLFQRGDSGRAIEYFEKEARAFPESSALMNKLIARVKQRQSGAESRDSGTGTDQISDTTSGESAADTGEAEE